MKLRKYTKAGLGMAAGGIAISTGASLATDTGAAKGIAGLGKGIEHGGTILGGSIILNAFSGMTKAVKPKKWKR